MTPSIVFDIETSGLPEADQLETFQPVFEPDARLKDAAKIEASITEKREAWLETAALHAERSRVLCIGMTSEGQVSILEGDEKPMLEQVWRNFDSSNALWIGHNIKGFDVPYLARRSYIQGVKVPLGLMDGRYLSRRFIDTMEVWGAGERGARISLDNLSRALGVGKKSGSGKDFAALYRSNREEALAYLRQDLALAAACAKKMEVMV